MHTCTYTYLYEQREKYGRIVLRCSRPCLFSTLRWSRSFPQLVACLQLPHTLLRLTCDIEKTALVTGAKSLLRELELFGSCIPHGLCTGRSRKPSLQADKLLKYNLHPRAFWERRQCFGFPLKLHPCLELLHFYPTSPIPAVVSPGPKSLICHWPLNCPRICFLEN